MKRHNYIFTLLAALFVFVMAACTPDSFGFGQKNYSPDDLVQGKAFSVTVEGNKVTLKSLTSGCTPLWVTPNGRSQESELTLELPFAGEYEVTYGVETQGGIVYGDPYTFSLSQNDFSLLTDTKWFYLADKNCTSSDNTPDAATLSSGISKRWYPCDGDYGIGQCTGPVMYMNPDDTDGNGSTDVVFENFKPNWDPGFQSWLIAEDNAYMDSYMEFSMDAANGCVAKMYRGEDGTKGNSTGTNMTGKFNLDLSDKTHPTISFTDCYSMHNSGFDAVCSNYTQSIKILELTPYMLQVATMRTNSEGAWWLVWNFVSEEVIKTKGACIPSDAAGLLEKTDPILPAYNNLDHDLFTQEIGGSEWTGKQMTFVVNDEMPYNFKWWNGAPNALAWENVIDSYNSTWAPAADEDDVADFSLTLNKKDDGTYTYEYAGKTVYDGCKQEGTVKIDENTMEFSDSVYILSASSSSRNIVLKGKKFTILGCSSDDQSLVIGVPSSYDENGTANSYLVANLKYKQVSSGTTGPTVVKVDNTKLNTYLQEDGKYFRIELYNPWGDKEWPIDITKVKVKKDQTLSVTFTVSGITWNDGAAPKAALCHNMGSGLWEPACFSDAAAVTLNKNGETTVTWKNTTGSTATFNGNSCVTVAIQLAGYGTAATDADGNLTTTVNVTSLTIQ